MQLLLWNPGPGWGSLYRQQGHNPAERLLHAGQGAFPTKNDPDQEPDPEIWRLGCHLW